MSIVSSTHTVGGDQAGGGNYVMETHTDSQGKTYTRQYLAAAGANIVAIRDAYAVALAAQLADEEAAQIVSQP